MALKATLFICDTKFQIIIRLGTAKELNTYLKAIKSPKSNQMSKSQRL